MKKYERKLEIEYWDNIKTKKKSVTRFEPATGRRDGLSVTYFPDGGMASKTQWKNGLIVGHVVTYFNLKDQDGYPLVHIKTPYFVGVRHGIEKVFDLSGKVIEEIPWKEGKRDGVRRILDNCGCLTECVYKEDVLDGLCEKKSSRGELLYQCLYRKGAKVGLEIKKEQTDEGAVYLLVERFYSNHDGVYEVYLNYTDKQILFSHYTQKGERLDSFALPMRGEWRQKYLLSEQRSSRLNDMGDWFASLKEISQKRQGSAQGYLEPVQPKRLKQPELPGVKEWLKSRTRDRL